MPTFSRNSISRLRTCDKRIQRICYELIKVYDFSVLCGHRTKAEQDKAFYSHKSKLLYPQSKHNKYPSLAVDIAPWHPGKGIDWEDTRAFYYMAGRFMQVADEFGYKIRYGGDWDGDADFEDQTFNDLCHFELVL